MTNPPGPIQDPTPPPTPDPAEQPAEIGAPAGGVPPAHEASATVPEAGASDIALPPEADEGTFPRFVEPRSDARLRVDDGIWHRISPKYVAVQLISSGILVALVAAVALVLWLVLNQTWVLVPAGILLVIMIWTMAIVPRQARAYGFRLRRDDLVFRRGILWQRFVAVPYGRMQLVDITHGPLDRGFGIAQLKLVTAAATTGVVIPGLAQHTAEQLRDVLIDVAETRRTGL